jgi:hypothetical protein
MVAVAVRADNKVNPSEIHPDRLDQSPGLFEMSDVAVIDENFPPTVKDKVIGIEPSSLDEELVFGNRIDRGQQLVASKSVKECN